jgi:hypothetical protein
MARLAAALEGISDVHDATDLIGRIASAIRDVEARVTALGVDVPRGSRA